MHRSHDSGSGQWFSRRTTPSPTAPNRDHSVSPTPHYTRRRPQTPPVRVISPTGVAGRVISTPLENPTLLASLPGTPPSPSPLSPRTRQISAPSSNPTLTSQSLIERNRANSLLSLSIAKSSSGIFDFRRPSDSAVELLFARYLKSRGVVELPGRTIDQKWRLVYQDEYFTWAVWELPQRLPQISDSPFIEESPEWYISKIVGMSIIPQEAEWLSVSLRYNDAKWFESFVDMRGSYAIALWLARKSRNFRPREQVEDKTHITVVHELVRCLQYIFNNKLGVVDALKHNRIVTCIASAMKTKHISTLKLITDILTVLTLSDDEKAFPAVLKALEDLSLTNDLSGAGLGRYDYWFELVRDILSSGRDGAGVRTDETLMQYVLSTFRLINSIVGHSNDIQNRLQCRTQLETSGLSSIVDIVKTCGWAALDEPLLRLELLEQNKPNTPVELNLIRYVTTSSASQTNFPPSAPPPAITRPVAPLRKTSPLPSITVTNGTRTHTVAPIDPDEAKMADMEGAPVHREYFDPHIHNTRRLNIKKRNHSVSNALVTTPTSPQSKGPPPAALPLRSLSLRDPHSQDTIPTMKDAPAFSVRRKPVPLDLIDTPEPPSIGVELIDVLETPSPEFRSELIVATQRLAGKSGLYPVCYELPVNEITDISNFSESSGAFADIFKGDFLGRPVCLKAIRMNRAADLQQFLKVFNDRIICHMFLLMANQGLQLCSKEAILWGQLSHPNLLPFYGIYRFRNGLSLVSPWMQNGDINIYLKNHRTADRLLLAYDIINGLKFLHENNIVHGDLKGPNILVDDSGIACVADFGLSSISDPNIPVFTSQSSAASRGGSARWQAPELFDPESEKDAHNTVQSDVYAYACVLYEIFVEKPPLFQYSRDHTVSFKVMNGERPTRPANGSSSWEDWGLTKHIWSLMERCWLTEPEERPTVEHIVHRLKFGMIKDTRSNKQRDTLAPARFREMARKGVNHDEMSVEAFEAFLKSG
ncbi:hypothetical protein C0991_007876 [Blastosporella zonata]|nr:hypothetical protein C0991_007876 [Blastosporella zonata]